MSIAIDAAGRLVIPKAVRDAAGITPQTPLEVRCRDGRIEIEPAPVALDVVSDGGVAVAVARNPTPVLPAEEVARVRDRLRGERA